MGAPRCPGCGQAPGTQHASPRCPNWTPRGVATWPDYREARFPVRVRAVRGGWEATALGLVKQNGAPAVRVRWDRNGYEGVVVAPAFALEVMP